MKKTSHGLFLSQQLYLSNLLKSCGMDNVKASSTPLLSSQDFVSHEEVIDNPKEYRRIIGSLLYLTFTRPDIQFTINKLSRFMSSPKPDIGLLLKRFFGICLGHNKPV